jgi:hypothetical protein
VHDKADTVGVIVVEDVKPGQAPTGWVMEGDGTIMLKAIDAVPLGLRSLLDLKPGDTVLKWQRHRQGRGGRRQGRHVQSRTSRPRGGSQASPQRS